jgi:tetratricopeptide (TPR) repeat protein
MSKKASKTKTKRSSKRKPNASSRPEPAQLRAIERLLEAEDFAEATARARRLVQRFPDHGSAQALLIDALRRGQGAQFAAVAVHDWAERRPQSLFAQEQLLTYAIEGGYLMLAEHVAERVRALGGKAPSGFPLTDEVKTALCTLADGNRADAAEMVEFDRGRLSMSGFAFAKALRYFEGLDLSGARNNRIACLFHLGRIDAALSAALEEWREEDENLFALAWAASLRLYRGDLEGASGLAARLAVSTARGVDETTPQLIALLLLDQPEDAWAAYGRAVESSWWQGIQDLTAAIMTHLGACAVARCGELKRARQLWREVERASPEFALAVQNRSAAAKGETLLPAVLEMHNALPGHLLGTLRTQIQTHGAEQAEQTLLEIDASNAYLRALAINGDGPLRQGVTLVLRHRAQQRDNDEVVAVLRELVRLPIGTPNDRFELLRSLREAGRLGEDELVEFWDGDTIRAIKMFQMEVHREPTDTGLPDALVERLEDAQDDYNDHRYKDCESKLQPVLEASPDQPQALMMLASIRHLAGRRGEAERLLRQAIEANPDYLLARCNLARALILRGDLDAASELLDGQREQHRIHIIDLIQLYGTIAMLETARGDDEAAETLLKAVESFIQDDDEAQRLDEVRRLVWRVKGGSPWKRVFGALGAIGRRA